jgi:hypothetical protein
MMATHHCPQCGADLTGQPRCWLCYSDTKVRPTIATGAQVPSVAVKSNGGFYTASWQFGLDSLLLMMTFAAVLVGAFAAAPGLGVAVALVSAAPLLRTVIVARKGRVAGVPLTPLQKALSFFAGVAFIVVLAVSVGIAFYLTCWVGFIGVAFGSSIFGRDGLGMLAPALWTGFIFGGIAGIVVAVWIIRRTIRRDFSIPRWLAWVALVLGASVMLIWLIFANYAFELQLILLIISAGALGVALFSLKVSKPLVTPIAIGFCTGPALAALMLLPFGRGYHAQPSLAQHLVARGIALAIALAVATALYYLQLRRAEMLAVRGNDK